MFTGIISDVGEVIEITPQESATGSDSPAPMTPASIALGASIAISGACLTVVDASRGMRARAIAFDVGAETLAVTTLGAGGRATRSTSSARCGWATNSAAIWSAAMSTASRKSCRAATSTAWRISAFAPRRACQIHRAQRLGRARRNLAHRERRRGRGFRGPADPAHARRDRLGRAENGRSGQHRGRPDGPLRRASHARGAAALSMSSASLRVERTRSIRPHSRALSAFMKWSRSNVRSTSS